MKTIKKLSLRKETITNLNQDEMTNLKGGYATVDASCIMHSCGCGASGNCNSGGGTDYCQSYGGCGGGDGGIILSMPYSNCCTGADCFITLYC